MWALAKSNCKHYNCGDIFFNLNELRGIDIVCRSKNGNSYYIIIYNLEGMRAAEAFDTQEQAKNRVAEVLNMLNSGISKEMVDSFDPEAGYDDDSHKCESPIPSGLNAKLVASILKDVMK